MSDGNQMQYYTHPKSEKFKNEAFISMRLSLPSKLIRQPKRSSKRRNLKRSSNTLKHPLKMHVGWLPDAVYSGPVHAKPEEFENVALFLRLGLGLPSTLIRSFRKRSFRGVWKRRLSVLFWKCKDFRNNEVTILMISHWPSFLKHKSRVTSDGCFWNFSIVSFVRFQNSP